MNAPDWKQQIVAWKREQALLIQRISELEKLLREERALSGNLRQSLLQLIQANPELRVALEGQPRSYADWVAQYDTPAEAQRRQWSAETANLATRISLILPLREPNLGRLRETVASVQKQAYPHWELWLTGDASSSPELRGWVEEAVSADSRIHAVPGTALEAAGGEFVTWIEEGALLAEAALYWVAREIADHPDLDLLFSDEDRIDDAGKRGEPHFKPDWNPALMLSSRITFGHLGVFRRALAARQEGWEEGGSEYDLALRCADVTTPDRIRHIPRVLYHGRRAASEAAPQAWEAGRLAIQDHLERRGIRGTVERRLADSYSIVYEPPSRWPDVSVIVPTTLRSEVTRNCLRSLLAETTYPNWEVILAINTADLAAARAVEGMPSLLADRRLRIMEYDRTPFNYSWVNNRAAEQSTAEYICCVNDDVEVLTPAWLEQLVLRGRLEGVGAVGAMLYFPNGTIQHAGVILGVGGVADHAGWGWARGAEGYFQRAALEQDFSCVTAACMLVRRELFARMGGFDEFFPYSYNDVDFCLRLRKAGWRVLWTPQAEMVHHESLTFGDSMSPERRVEFNRAFQEMKTRWGRSLELDPFYNPNLTLESRKAFLQPAFPPRVSP